MLDPIYSDVIIFSSLLGLLSIGLTLTYLTTRVPNFAHASFAAIGVYVSLIVSQIWEITPYVAVPISFAISGMVGLFLYRFILKPLIAKGSSHAIQMIATLAFDLIVIAVLNILADYITRNHHVISREFSLRSYDMQFFDMPLIIIVAPLVLSGLVISLYVILKKTKFGIAMRASTANSNLAETVGINVNLVYMISWITGAGLAGIAGALMSLWFSGDPHIGVFLIPSIFAASIVGGFLSIYGAVAGAVIIGVTEVLGTRVLAGEIGSWVVAYRPLIPLLFIVITLLIAPNGIAGTSYSRIKRWIRL